MGVQRLDNIEVVVEDLEGAVAFFTELGLELEGRASVEGETVDRLLALEGVRTDVAMVRAPNGVGLELVKFQRPLAVGPDPSTSMPYTRGMGRVMLEVEDIEGVVASALHMGGELMGEIVTYGDTYRLCYLRGPEGIIVALAESLS